MLEAAELTASLGAAPMMVLGVVNVDQRVYVEIRTWTSKILNSRYYRQQGPSGLNMR